jgi:two-component system CheB/CheR fusion protein
MVLNELATNASKYGALSLPAGKVEISWNIADGKTGERMVQLAWIERDGPAVNTKSHQGFGTSFIARSVAYELGGTAELEMVPEGARCRIEFPLSRQSVPLPP